MSRGYYNNLLLRTIYQHHLDERDPEVEQVAQLAEYGMSEDHAKCYLIQIQDMVDDQIDHPNLLHRLPDHDQLYEEDMPDIEIGAAVDDPELRIGLRYRTGPHDILICGNKGSGKTTAILGIIDRIEQINQHDPDHRTSIIYIDRKGGDAAHLPDRYGDHWLHLSVHDPRTHIGLNNPPGVPPNVWINTVATAFAARAGLVAAWTCMAGIIRWLLPILNPKPTPQLIWPSLSLVLEVSRTAPLTAFASKPDYERSLIQQLEAATTATHLFDCFGGLDLERDIISQGKSLVLDISNLGPTWVRRFVIDLLISQTLVSRLQRNVKVDRTDALLVFDEADQDVSTEAEHSYPDQMSPLSHMLRAGRELGLGVIIGVSNLSRASAYARAEPHYHLIFNQSDARAIHETSNTLLLPRGAEQMLPGLLPGQCIFRQAQASWMHPMKVQIDYHAVRREVLTRPYDAHPWIPARSLENLPHAVDAIRQLTAAHRGQKLRQQKAATPKPEKTLSRPAHALMHAKATHEWHPVARLWEITQLKPTPQTQNDVREELEQHDLSKFEQVRIGSANVLLMALTERGWRYLQRTPPKAQGRGSIAHQHCAHWLQMFHEKRGDKAQTEWIISGTSHPVDVAVQTPAGKTHVYEIAITAFDNLASHIKACFVDSNAIDHLTIVVIQKGIRRKVLAQLKADAKTSPHLARITVDILADYLKELF